MDQQTNSPLQCLEISVELRERSSNTMKFFNIQSANHVTLEQFAIFSAETNKKMIDRCFYVKYVLFNSTHNSRRPIAWQYSSWLDNDAMYLLFNCIMHSWYYLKHNVYFVVLCFLFYKKGPLLNKY